MLNTSCSDSLRSMLRHILLRLSPNNPIHFQLMIMTKVVGGKISEPTTFCYSLEFLHRYMKVHVFVTMVSKRALKSPNLLPSFTKTAISLNDGITRRDRVRSHLSGYTYSDTKILSKHEKTATESLLLRFVVVPPGIEPGTQGFSVLCSTN